MLIAYCIGCLATLPRCRLVLGCPDSGLVGGLILCGFPARASVGAVLGCHAISDLCAGIGRPDRMAVDPASGNYRARDHRPVHSSGVPARGGRDGTGDRPGR